MTKKRTWKEFQDAGLLWLINCSLHLFGWCIVFECDEAGEVLKVYPAKTSYRGFSDAANSDGYTKVTKHLEASMPQLVEDVAWEDPV